MKLEFTRLVPMLMCDNVPASIQFYTQVLGFQVNERIDDIGRSGWASLNHGSVQLMLASSQVVPEAAKVQGRLPQTLYYFYPNDVMALHDVVVQQGYPCTDLVVRFYGMKEFEVVDPSGHVLLFCQPTDEPPTPVEE